MFCDFHMHYWGRCGSDRIVVGFTTTCAISAYQYLIQHYVIKFVRGRDLQLDGGFLGVLWFPPPLKLTTMIHAF